MINEIYDTEPYLAAGKRAVELSSGLPRARARTIDGYVARLLPGQDADKGLELIREAYRESPDDPAIATILVWSTAESKSTSAEAEAVAHRLMARSPTRALGAACHVLRRAADRFEPPSPLRSEMLRLLHETMPESRGWGCSLRHLLASSDLVAARDAVSFRRQLNRSSIDPDGEQVLAMIELAALQPAKAREHAQRNMGDPDVERSLTGHQHLVASYWMEGRVVDAETASARLRAAFRALGPQFMAYYETEEVFVARLLGRPPPSMAHLLDLARTSVAVRNEIERFLQEGELATALARSREPGARQAASRALESIETEAAARAGGDRERLDTILACALPAVRALRGDAAAAAWFRAHDRALLRARRAIAFDAGLALEALNDRASAAAAYELAFSFDPLSERPFPAMASRLRLARLRRAKGREKEAIALESTVARLWSQAEPGVREAILKLR